MNYSVFVKSSELAVIAQTCLAGAGTVVARESTIDSCPIDGSAPPDLTVFLVTTIFCPSLS